MPRGKHKPISFRRDLRNKFIRFAILPILLLGVFGSVIVYNAEENTIIDNHNHLLVSIDNRIKNFQDDVAFLCQAIEKKFRNDRGKAQSDLFEDVLLFNMNIYAVDRVDVRHGTVEEIDRNFHRKTRPIDPKIRRLIAPLTGDKKTYRTDAYYSPHADRVLLSCVVRLGADQYAIFHITLDRLLRFIRSLSEKDPRQSIVLVNRRGEYISNTLAPETVKQKKNFFQTGAYAIAVKQARPFELTEFPAHYQKGDSFVKGIFDEDHFITYTPQKKMGWLIVIRDYYDNLDPFLNKMLAIVTFFILGTMILMFIAVRITTDKIMTPVETLIDRIKRFAQGDTQSLLTIDPDNTYPIFVSLIESFNNMQLQIHARREELSDLNKNLENLVRKKTRSLEELNKNLEKIIEEKVAENLAIQRRLALKEKLASMGEMIGNIAHQWRQPLSVISTLATGLKTQKMLGTLEEGDLERACDQINANSQYLSRTIDDFRNFIRGDQGRSVFRIDVILESFFNIVESQTRSHGITITTDVDTDVTVRGYKNDLIQGLINLFNNAKDAFVERAIDARYVSITAHRNGASVVMTFTDNAGGIAPDVLDRIFEPYFTTKHPSQGTGLGLHMTYKLISAMGGEIAAENVTVTYEGVTYTGARFTIVLPVYVDGETVTEGTA